MPWDQRLSTGHDGIDKQHRVLIDLLDQIQSVGEDDYEASMSVVLDLTRYVIQHFDYEQEMMARFSYPDRQAHQKEHSLLIGQVKGFLDQLSTSELSRNQLHALLTDWVNVHICSVDKQFGAFLNGRN